MEMQVCRSVERSGHQGTGEAQGPHAKEASQRNMEGKVRISSKGFAKEQKRATARQLLKLIRRQGKQCALSGRRITKRTAELDHKTPWSLTKDDSIENLQWIDAKINAAKGAMSSEEFIAMCRDVVQYQDKQASMGPPGGTV